MLNIYQTVGNQVEQTEQIEKGVWINLINPTAAEIRRVSGETGLYQDFLRYPLDDEELPRVETEDDQVLIIINVPIFAQADVVYETIPLGIVLNDDYIVTVCLDDLQIAQEFNHSRVKGMATFKKTRFIFQLFSRKTNLYLKYLRDIDRRHQDIETELHKSMKNQELISLLNLQKSLVYFTTSLRSNDKVMEKLLRTKALKMYEEDEDLLEDVIIENKQAIEMADIYSNISTSTLDVFASIISNNLNIVLKILTGITIALAIPTMIASFFGMNVELPFSATGIVPFFIIVLISIVGCGASVYLLWKKNML